MPSIILLDEPFNAIDAKTVSDLIALIKRWHGEKRTVMVVVHDLDLVREHFPETLLLARRPIAWGPTRRGAAAGKPAARPPFRRGLARRCAVVRAARTATTAIGTMAIDHPPARPCTIPARRMPALAQLG